MIKSLVVHAGFLGWSPCAMYETELKAQLIAELPVAQVSQRRTLITFRRRQGALPLTAIKLLNAIRGQVPHGT